MKVDAIAVVDAADIAETPDHFVAAKNKPVERVFFAFKEGELFRVRALHILLELHLSVFPKRGE